MGSDELRRRRGQSTAPKGNPESLDKQPNKTQDAAITGVGTYWLTRVVFMRFIAGIYMVAFCVSLEQNPALIGSNGLTPVDSHLDDLRRRFGFRDTPVASGR